MATRLVPFLFLAGAALAVPAPASADPGREAELEARLHALEAAVAELRGALAAARAEAAVMAETVPAPQQDGFRVGATTVRLGGFLRTNAMMSRFSGGDLAGQSLGRDLYLPQQIPVGGAATRRFDAHAKQTRIALSTATPVANGTLAGLVEIDFQTAPGTQGSERTTNGHAPALRRAFVTYGDFLVGQEWSVFQYTGALPETTDFVGPTEGTVFVRQTQARYTRRLGEGLSLAVSLENPETATITPAAAALVENDDDRLPDAAARLVLARPFGELSLAGVVRRLSAEAGADAARATGWGLSLGGRLPFGPERRHDVRFMLSGGEGIGRYIGLNFAPDAVLIGADLETVRVLAGFAALKLGWGGGWRSTFMGSFQDVSYPHGLAPPAANAGAWSLAANLFHSPAPGFDLGVEYRHGARELLSGARGRLDRFEFAAKYSF